MITGAKSRAVPARKPRRLSGWRAGVGAALLAGFYFGAPLAEESQLKKDAKKAGHEVGSAFRQMGKDAKKAGKTIGHGAAKAGRDVGHAAKKSGREVKQAIKGEKESK